MVNVGLEKCGGICLVAVQGCVEKVRAAGDILAAGRELSITLADLRAGVRGRLVRDTSARVGRVLGCLIGSERQVAPPPKASV